MIEQKIGEFAHHFESLVDMAHDADYVECLGSARKKLVETKDMGIEHPSFTEWFEKIRSDED